MRRGLIVGGIASLLVAAPAGAVGQRCDAERGALRGAQQVLRADAGAVGYRHHSLAWQRRQLPVLRHYVVMAENKLAMARYRLPRIERGYARFCHGANASRWDCFVKRQHVESFELGVALGPAVVAAVRARADAATIEVVAGEAGLVGMRDRVAQDQAAVRAAGAALAACKAGS